MRQFEKKKNRDKLATMLILSFCVIALTSIFTIKASIDKVAKSAENIPVTKEVPSENEKHKDKDEKETAKPKTNETTSSKTDSNVSTTAQIVDSEKEAPNSGTFVAPMDMVSAKVLKEYSMDMVIYNKTLDQYMTHPGLDISGEENANVLAVTDGLITGVYKDDSYGVTIELTCDNGYTVRYCNLATDKLIEKGDRVKQSQVISTIGKSGLFESADKTHVHIEIQKDGNLVDPAKVLPL